MYSKIQYISQGDTIMKQLDAVKSALDAGCTWIQLRYKNRSEAEVLELATQVKEITQQYSCTYIINDYPHIAKLVDAHGIHLGLDDMPIAEARKILGPDKIIGGTANTLSHVIQRIDEQCDYIGLGPFKFTTTKEKLSPILGLQGYSDIMAQIQQATTIPVYAIGGIEQGDISPILQTGVYGVALSGLITHHTDKKQLLNNLDTLCSHYI